MSDRPYDEPAFPIRGGLNEHQFSGLTMRDYFAAKALAGVLIMIANGQHQPRPSSQSGPDFIATTCFEIADAMLKARAQP